MVIWLFVSKLLYHKKRGVSFFCYKKVIETLKDKVCRQINFKISLHYQTEAGGEKNASESPRQFKNFI